jgi:NAD(P)H-hydrate epimerase
MHVRSLFREELRAIDSIAVNDYGIPMVVLMENAGRGAANWVYRNVPPGSVLVLAGRGNNGGDAGVVARHLDVGGYRVQVAWLAQRHEVQGDAATQLHILEKSTIKQCFCAGQNELKQLGAMLQEADWVVDGLLGTGLSRRVEGWLHSVIEALNRAGKPVLALDIPSGLDADTGQPCGIAVRAQCTVTFVAPKVGFGQPEARSHTGEVVVVDIGLPRRLLEPYLID